MANSSFSTTACEFSKSIDLIFRWPANQVRAIDS